MSKLKNITILIFFILISWNMESQEDKAWNFTIAPYLFTPYTSGDIIVAGNEQDIYTAPSDILGDLKMAGMLYLEAANAKWSISADVLYLKLGTDFNVPAPPAPAPINANIGADATLLGFYGMYRLADWFDKYVQDNGAPT